MNRKIGQQPALGVRKRARDQVKARQRDNRIAQAAEAMNQDPANGEIRLQTATPKIGFRAILPISGSVSVCVMDANRPGSHFVTQL